MHTVHAIFGIAILAALQPQRAVSAIEQSPSALHADTITLSIGRRVTMAGGGLTIELLSVNDSRCPISAQCVWQGQATLTLRITTRARTAPQTVTLGSSAPPSMKLPGDLTIEGRRFRLVQLRPERTTTATVRPSLYRARVEVQRL